MTASSTLYLVRHGQSRWNELGLVQGQSTDAPGLTQAGLAQASKTARALADSGVDVVLSSDLTRAMETAEPIAQALGVSIESEPRLRERSLGAAEGMAENSLSATASGFLDGVVIDADAKPHDGESIRELYSRAANLIDELFERSAGKKLVAVTHGGFIRVAIAYVSGISPELMRWPVVFNGSYIELKNSRVFSVISLNS